MKDMLDARLAFPRGRFERASASPHHSAGPAIGLVLGLCASLLMWLGLAHVVRWVSHALF